MDYIEVLGEMFPNVQASCIGDSTVYANIRWEKGDPLPSEADLIAAGTQDNIDDTWEKIKAERDRRKFGGIKVGDSWFHSDDTSRIQQLGLVMLGANIPPGLMWKTMSGSFVTMTQALAGSIFQTIAMNDTAIFKVAEQHKSRMTVSADPLSYDYLSGWPVIYGE